jgi:2-isopropylmalate synthase
VALNLYMHGIDPKLDFSALNSFGNLRTCTGMTEPRAILCWRAGVHRLHGSHQDAIRKVGRMEKESAILGCAVLTIDPRDIGREYREVIRVNTSRQGRVAICWRPILASSCRRKCSGSLGRCHD